MQQQLLDQIVKAYDVRGQVGDIADAVVAALGAGAAVELAASTGRFAIGRDMRPSSPRWAAAFANGLRHHGVEVIDLGLASTDLVSFASGSLDVPAAMITASHNPAGYNGIKFCRAGAVPVAIDSGLHAIREIAAAELASGVIPEHVQVAADGSLTGPAVERIDLVDAFATHVRSFIDGDRLKAVSLAVDAGNGMAGAMWPAVVSGLPITTAALYFDLDGTFPNHPADPLDPANLLDLIEVVQQGGFAMGLAFDGDADRVFAVDETGRPVPSSLVGAAVAERMLTHHPGATILHNLICSRVVPETIEASGGHAVRTRVGHSYIKQVMAETGAIFGVEHSGHYYFRDNFRADSGLIAALVLLEAVSEADAPLSQVLAPYRRTALSEERNLKVADPAGTLRHVLEVFADRALGYDLEDGLTMQFDDGWFNLRPSNTEPLLRLNAEGDDDGSLTRLLDAVLAELPRSSR